MANNRKPVFESVLEACQTACAAGIPILYLLTEEADLADAIVLSDRLVARRALVKCGDGQHFFVPLEEYEPLQRQLDREMGIDDGAARYVPAAVNYAEGKSCWDSLVTGDVKAHAIPSIGVIKNFNLYAEAAGVAVVAEQMARHIQCFLAAKEGSALRKSVLLLSAPVLLLPQGLEQYVEVIDVPPPDDGEIEEILLGFNNGRETLGREYRSRLVENLRGFGGHQIRTLLQKTVIEADFLTNNAKVADRLRKGLSADIPAHEMPETMALQLIVQEKEQMLKKSGVLSWEKREPVEVGGLEELVGWLQDKKRLLDHLGEATGEWGIEFPKGVLVCGVPGSGKSLMAKKASEILGIPLIKMDMGALLGKYVGESEQNMRRALQMAEAMSPCVLWIDELEKAFSGAAGGSHDNAASRRSFATLLTWMQENNTACFLFATANDIREMPSEFLRRGRFDQKFFVYMPLRDECVQIFQAELARRRRLVESRRPGAGETLFEKGLLEDTAFWGEMVDLFAVGPDGEVAAKFLTGADIAGVVNDLILGLYREGGSGDKNTARITASRVRAALTRLAPAAQTYGETDLQAIAECYVGLWEKRFRPASKHTLFSYRDYDPRRDPPMVPQRDRTSRRYDDLLFNAVRDEINRLFTKKG